MQLGAIKLYDGTNVVDNSDTVTITTSAGENLRFFGAQTAYNNVNDANNYFTHFTLVNGVGAGAGLASNYTLPDLSTHHPANNYVSVNQRGFRITASDETKEYGVAGTLDGTSPSSFSTSGLQNGETVGSVTLTASGEAN